LGTMALHWKTSPLAHGRSIVPNRSEPEATATGETNSRKTRRRRRLRVGRSHWGQWLYTGRLRRWRMVDRLSPIDQRLKPPQPVRQTAENQKTPPLARRAELLGTMALHCKTSPLAHGRSIVPNRSAPNATATGETNSRKQKDAAACASGGAIGDNGSTLQDFAAGAW